MAYKSNTATENDLLHQLLFSQTSEDTFHNPKPQNSLTDEAMRLEYEIEEHMK